MFSDSLSRLGAGTALVGAVVVGVVLPLTPSGFGSPLRPVTTLMALAGAILIVMGAPTLFMRIWERDLVLGLISYVALMLMLLLFQVALGAIEGTILPYLATHGGMPAKHPAAMGALGLLGLAAQVIGTIALTVAILRGRAYPRWLAVLLLASLAAAALPIPVQLDGTLMSASLVVMAAYTLRRGSTERPDVVETSAISVARA